MSYFVLFLLMGYFPSNAYGQRNLPTIQVMKKTVYVFYFFVLIMLIVYT